MPRASINPGNHWIRRSAWNNTVICDASGEIPIIMAMDFTNVFSPAYVRSRLETTETLKGQDADLDQISEVLASIKGVETGLIKRVSNIRADRVITSQGIPHPDIDSCSVRVGS